MAKSSVSEQPDERDFNCAICMEVAAKTCVHSVCKSIYCKDCIINLFKQGHQCAICKQPIIADDTKINQELEVSISLMQKKAECGALVPITTLEEHL